MKVPLLDLKAQLAPLETEIKKAVCDVIDSTSYIMGPKVEELEKQIAQYCDVKEGIGVSSGTDALLVALMALDVGPGDIVLTTPFSFFASAGVIARLHATPMFVDILPDTFNMDPAALRIWLEREKELRTKVKAIIPIHLFGQTADMDPICDLAREFNIPIIEDAAQAIGATYPSRDGVKKAGSMGLMGCFSFFPSKNLGGVGDGGMVVTNDPQIAEKLRRLRNHGAKPKYYHAMIGGNFRLDPVQAAVLLVKLPHLEKWHAKRRENAQLYDELILTTRVRKPIIKHGRQHHIFNQYVLTVQERRDEFRAFLTKNEIGNEVYYPVPFHQQECFKYLNIASGTFPHSEKAAEHSVAIPIYPELTSEMQEYVAGKIKEFYA